MSIVLDGTTGLAGAATGALNGALGGTTPSTVVATSVNTPNTFGFKNRIINGSMVFDQRNEAAAVSANDTYPVDRFLFSSATDGTVTAQRDTTVPAGYINSLKFTTTVADASLGATQFCAIRQRIEGYNVNDLGWGAAGASSVTLSFWVRSSLTGTFGGAITNAAFDRSYPFTYTISAANTWEQKTVTVAGDTTGTWATTTGIGMQIAFGIGVGSTYSGTAGSWAAAGYLSATGATNVVGTLSATLYITGVQLEKGSTATSFDVRDYGRELIMCQRYYQKTFQQGTAVANCSITPNSSWIFTLIGASCVTMARLPVAMRTAPTVTTYSSVNSVAGTWRMANSAGAGSNGTTAIGNALDNNVSITVSGTTHTYGNGEIVCSAEL